MVWLRLVRGALDADPLCGHLFVFRNKRGDRLKILAWDRDGWIRFFTSGSSREFSSSRWDCAVTSMPSSITVRPEELTMLLAGIDLASVRRQKRYGRPA